MPPSQCKGGKDAVKYKAETFTTELDKARQQKEVGHLHSFVMGTCGALNRSEHRFATKAASLIMEWFMRGCAAMEAWGALAVLYYFEEYLRVYRGRGLPVLYDAEIASRSQGRGKQGSAPKSTMSGFMGQDASSQDDSSRALSEQMAELLKAQTQIASSVSSMSGQVSRLQSEVAAVKSAQAAPGAPSGSGFVPFMQRACHHCGEKGHVIADCPERKEKEKNKKKGDDADA